MNNFGYWLLFFCLISVPTKCISMWTSIILRFWCLIIWIFFMQGLWSQATYFIWWKKPSLLISVTMTQLTAGLNRLPALLHMEMVVKIKKCEVIRNAESYDINYLLVGISNWWKNCCIYLWSARNLSPEIEFQKWYLIRNFVTCGAEFWSSPLWLSYLRFCVRK